MYYRTNSTVLSQPVQWYMNTDKIKSIVTYVMGGLFEKIDNSKHGIKDNAIGYTNEKYNQLEEIYSMAYTNINSLTKNYIVANTSLDDISKLEKNWNDNGASAFSAKLIEKCREIVNQLVAEPFVRKYLRV